MHFMSYHIYCMELQFSSVQLAHYSWGQNQCSTNSELLRGRKWQKGLEQTGLGGVVHDGKGPAPRKHGPFVGGDESFL